ncbi:MAG: tetraacyldisaccharide 4'-kinase [Pyrinomonadaceae bacterium]
MNPLTPAGMLYGLVMDVRNRMYDAGILPSYSLGARAISIGNLTTGGTGKTPLVALTAAILAESGEKVCVLTRGYGRRNERERVLVSDGDSVLVDAAKGGDEPVELARKLLGKGVVVADADRVGAAKWAKDKFGITAFVLDDAFQHRRVKRDLDIVCIDATQDLDAMIPAGRLREPLQHLRRADAVVITRSDLVASVEDLNVRISDHAPAALIFRAENEISRITPLDEYRSGPKDGDLVQDWKKLRPDDRGTVRLFAFCGLGNPANFFHLLNGEFEKEGMTEFDLSIAKAFSDHHSYSQRDIDELEKQAGECGIDALLTTAKDAGKLRNLKVELPCYVVEIEPRIDNIDRFRAMITSA